MKKNNDKQINQTRMLTLFVSTKGNDTNSGTQDKPFATITGARDALRNINHNDIPVTIQVDEGIYHISEPIVFTPQDSGSATAPVRYIANPNARVIISGGRSITSSWKKYNENIWVTHIDDVKNGSWYFRQLFINDIRQTRARIPFDSEFSRIIFDENNSNKTTCICDEGQIPNWSNLDDAEIEIQHAWECSRLRIVDVDKRERTIKLENPPYKVSFGRGTWYIDNVFDGLGVPGRWYLKRSTGELFVWPENNCDIKTANIIAPVTKELIRFQGDLKNNKFVHDIELVGFVFSENDWSTYAKSPEKVSQGAQAASDVPGAISFEGTFRCKIQNSIIKHIGTYGINLSTHVHDISIIGNKLFDIGAGAIRIGNHNRNWNENEPTFDGSVKRNFVKENHIYNTGIVYPGAVGIWISQSGQNIISHNLIHDISYTGISVGWTWNYTEDNPAKYNIIEYNEIHHCMQTMDDGAGIYTLGTSPGTIIRNNVVHDIHPHTNQGEGIYLDVGSEHILVENNLVYRCTGGLLFFHKNANNIVRNNIFVDGTLSQIKIGQGIDNEIRGNIFARMSDYPNKLGGSTRKGEYIVPIDKRNNNVNWPTKWTAFGILEKDTPLLTTNELSHIPEKLIIQNKICDKKIITAINGTVDFGKAFTDKSIKNRMGYAFAELDIEEDQLLTIGIGADWWTKIWIDGKSIFSSMDSGNYYTPDTISDHIHSVFLTKGTHIIAVAIAEGSAKWRFVAGCGEKVLFKNSKPQSLPHCFTVTKEAGTRFGDMDFNLYYGTEKCPVNMFGMDFSSWQKNGLDIHSIIANPMFSDYENDDFSLLSTSPALKLGFKQFDINKAGLTNK